MAKFTFVMNGTGLNFPGLFGVGLVIGRLFFFATNILRMIYMLILLSFLKSMIIGRKNFACLSAFLLVSRLYKRNSLFHAKPS